MSVFRPFSRQALFHTFLGAALVFAVLTASMFAQATGTTFFTPFPFPDPFREALVIAADVNPGDRMGFSVAIDGTTVGLIGDRR